MHLFRKEKDPCQQTAVTLKLEGDGIQKQKTAKQNLLNRNSPGLIPTFVSRLRYIA